MARLRVFPPIALLLLLLIAAGEMTGTAKVAEARTCSTPSHKFKGLCFSSTNCGHVCRSEGFTGGECHGFRRRCLCTKPCPE